MSPRTPRSTLTAALVPYSTRCRACAAGGRRRDAGGGRGDLLPRAAAGEDCRGLPGRAGRRRSLAPRRRRSAGNVVAAGLSGGGGTACGRLLVRVTLPTQPAASTLMRSEEHTSELKSLMRIRYTAFSLTKKQYTTAI